MIELHQGVEVVRDDLLPGGTKSRYLHLLFADAEVVVYASPCQGGAQVALAQTAARLGKRAVIFCAKRAERHLRTKQAEQAGAEIIEVEPGYLNVVQARASSHCRTTGDKLAPFGMDIPNSASLIAEAALAESPTPPDEFWCAAGSGTLANGLAKAWPTAKGHVVQVGHKLSPLLYTNLHISPYRFDQRCKTQPPFPSDPHYDSKAWEMLQQVGGARGRRVIFWNVL